jgi:hypothetical protein
MKLVCPTPNPPEFSRHVRIAVNLHFGDKPAYQAMKTKRPMFCTLRIIYRYLILRNVVLVCLPNNSNAHPLIFHLRLYTHQHGIGGTACDIFTVVTTGHGFSWGTVPLWPATSLAYSRCHVTDFVIPRFVNASRKILNVRFRGSRQCHKTCAMFHPNLSTVSRAETRRQTRLTDMASPKEATIISVLLRLYQASLPTIHATVTEISAARMRDHQIRRFPTHISSSWYHRLPWFCNTILKRDMKNKRAGMDMIRTTKGRKQETSMRHFVHFRVTTK